MSGIHSFVLSGLYMAAAMTVGLLRSVGSRSGVAARCDTEIELLMNDYSQKDLPEAAGLGTGRVTVHASITKRSTLSSSTVATCS